MNGGFLKLFINGLEIITVEGKVFMCRDLIVQYSVHNLPTNTLQIWFSLSLMHAFSSHLRGCIWSNRRVLLHCLAALTAIHVVLFGSNAIHWLSAVESLIVYYISFLQAYFISTSWRECHCIILIEYLVSRIDKVKILCTLKRGSISLLPILLNYFRWFDDGCVLLYVRLGMLLYNNLVAAARRLLEWEIFQGGCHAAISLIGLLNLKFGVISLSSLRR